MTTPYAFILTAKTRPERADAFKALFQGYVAASREEPGCLEYHMLQDEQDPSLFIFFEVWASKAALDVHAALPHMTAFAEQRMDYLERDLEVQPIHMLSPASSRHSGA
jgi:quinol monooxygenase YgiN